jgi:hypothetical protein
MKGEATHDILPANQLTIKQFDYANSEQSSFVFLFSTQCQTFLKTYITNLRLSGE